MPASAVVVTAAGFVAMWLLVLVAAVTVVFVAVVGRRRVVEARFMAGVRSGFGSLG